MRGPKSGGSDSARRRDCRPHRGGLCDHMLGRRRGQPMAYQSDGDRPAAEERVSRRSFCPPHCGPAKGKPNPPASITETPHFGFRPLWPERQSTHPLNTDSWHPEEDRDRNKAAPSNQTDRYPRSVERPFPYKFCQTQERTTITIKKRYAFGLGQSRRILVAKLFVCGKSQG